MSLIDNPFNHTLDLYDIMVDCIDTFRKVEIIITCNEITIARIAL